MLYELRIYHMNPGKLPDINKRFSEVTFDLFKKHGIQVCDFWQDATGEEKIYYILAYKDKQDKEIRWSAFVSDPEWLAKKEASRKNGVIVGKIESYLMERVPYVTPTW